MCLRLCLILPPAFILPPLSVTSCRWTRRFQNNQNSTSLHLAGNVNIVKTLLEYNKKCPPPRRRDDGPPRHKGECPTTTEQGVSELGERLAAVVMACVRACACVSVRASVCGPETLAGVCAAACHLPSPPTIVRMGAGSGARLVVSVSAMHLTPFSHQHECNGAIAIGIMHVWSRPVIWHANAHNAFASCVLSVCVES